MLEIIDLHKSFGDRPVLRGVSLQVKGGEIFGLLGANGAGKTTLINIISQLLPADRGTVRLGGRVGVVPQENLLYRSLSCWENLAFFGELQGWGGAVLQKQVQFCLEAVSLAERAHSLVAELSGGMQRRLSVAIALLANPPLLILDEPTTGLDVEARFELWGLLAKLRQQGKTLLITTHLLEEAERLCDRLAILKQGQVIAAGTLEELQSLFASCQVLTMQVSPEEQPLVLQIAQAHGFRVCPHPHCLTFGLPRPYSISQVVALFPQVDIKAISLQPVRLEHIYLDLHRELCSQPETS